MGKVYYSLFFLFCTCFIIYVGAQYLVLFVLCEHCGLRALQFPLFVCFYITNMTVKSTFTLKIDKVQKLLKLHVKLELVLLTLYLLWCSTCLQGLPVA